MATLDDIPLRQRKQARTRHDLLRATLDRLRDGRTLDDINVKELCADAGVSEASFFNYFPRKSDVLVYFVQLWSLDLAWRVRHELEGAGAGAAIRAIFAATARQIADRPDVMAEIIAHQARWSSPPDVREVTLADRLMAYPDRPGIEDVPAIGLEGLLPPLIDRAVAEGELPRHVDRRAAFLALTAVFFGVPVALRRAPAGAIEGAYAQQVEIVWSGLQQCEPVRRRPRRRAARERSRS